MLKNFSIIDTKSYIEEILYQCNYQYYLAIHSNFVYIAMGRYSLLKIIMPMANLASVASAELESPLGPFASSASLAVNEMMTFYNESNGEFGTASTIPFWTTANAIETLTNYMIATNDASFLPTYLATLDNTLVKEQASGQWANQYRDDRKPVPSCGGAR